MRNIIVCAFVLLLMSSCGGTGTGELVGVSQAGEFFEPSPYGMLFIGQGSFNMGQNEQDVAGLTNAQTKTVTVSSFWMDETEITNSEYRQFVYWVRDSIARRKLAEQFDEFQIAEDANGNEIDPPFLNWDVELDWSNPEYAEVLEDMYYKENERFKHRKELDNRQWVYEYEWIDLLQAAKKSNRYNYETKQYEGRVHDIKGEIKDVKDRSAFIMKDRVLVYPDTLCFVADFTYSFNEPMTKMYFNHPGFDNYPIVGVTWKQATAFCIWRSDLLNNFLRAESQPLAMDYRLPTEAEWEYAARGGLDSGIYPWGGYYTRNNRGCFVANFKPLRGRYTDDGSERMTAVCSYAPNDFGLYDMAGNVAEWTSSAFDEASYAYVHDLNPDYQYNARPDEAPVMKRKVVRGGSWKDIAYFIQCGTRTYEYQDSATSYIGFRCVRDYIGE
ncbi:MAG: gliding motility-associated lipoprotein [Bacteroidales bacterium]|jgi:formylglycine-generating enzyme required for sulfatase activity|nr:gliding motility-associated lipoprotein [Bacteroidales bacterium]